MQEFSHLYVGVDWARQRHQGCVLTAEGELLEQRSFEHTGEGISKWIDGLLGRVQGRAECISVVIETHAVVEMLIERTLAVYSLNPKQLDRFRDRHTVAGAKDDRRDAYVLADSLRTDSKAFRRVELPSAERLMLRELGRLHDGLGEEFRSVCNRLGELMVRYFPQILELGSFYEDRWLGTLLEHVPRPELAATTPTETVRSLLRAYRVRKRSAEQVLDLLAQPALRVGPGVGAACERSVRSLLARYHVLWEQKTQVLAEMDTLLTPPDSTAAAPSLVAIIRSLPGCGPVVGAALVGEAGIWLDAQDATTLRTLCGVAPVTVQSGKRLVVPMRRACHSRLRQAVYH